MSRDARSLCAIVVMGVAGSGKSTLGVALAERLGWAFLEGDTLHPRANIEKMAGGVALTDQDRGPWLEAIARRIDGWRNAGQQGVVACSALKRAYRARLAGDAADLGFVCLKGDEPLLVERLSRRQGHFMPVALLASQLASLEAPGPDEAAITLDIALPLEIQIETVIRGLGLTAPPAPQPLAES